MLKRITITALFLITLFAAQWHLNRIQRVDAQVATIPSRTPTPGPATATNTPRPNPTNPPAQPTSPPAATDTPVPQPTMTFTAVPPTIDPGTLLPTAEACGEPPTVQALNNINVRSGPGTDYDILSTLFTGEVRAIAGRAEFAEWWFISLADGSEGWVADFTVTVQGYTGNVPLVAAPALDGSTPTPGPLWEPTPQTDCATATPEPTSTSTATAVPPSVTPSPVNTALPTETLETEMAAAAVNSPTETPPAPPAPANSNPTATSISGTPEPISGTASLATAVPLADNDGSDGHSSLLPIAGAILILIGIVGIIVIKRT
ncbi:MAG: hypothetical protein H6664_02840 [Ardenticatenaceae bacterium]|nr:hypothetical protein [Ardenticatenaceae bacterium]